MAIFRKFLRLRCPACGERIPVVRRRLAVGQGVHCPLCSAGLFVNRVHVEPDAKPLWQLVSREQFDEERRNT